MTYKPRATFTTLYQSFRKMNDHVRATLLTSAFLVAMLSPVHAAATFTPLGLFGGIATRGHDISGDGSVVAGNVALGSDRFRLFRWTRSEVTLGPAAQDIPGDSRTAISGNGTAVVAARPSGLPPHSVALRWDADGNVQLLGKAPILSTDIGSIPRDVSVDGSLVVGSMGSLVGEPQAFRWSEATGMSALSGLSSDVWSSANGISGDGTIIVGEMRTTPSRNSSDAFRWTADTGAVALPRPANSIGAFASAVSSDGLVIAGSMALVPPIGDRQFVAFRWTDSNGLENLGDLPGGHVESRVSDISADGSTIVGRSETFFEDGVGATTEAFYWTEQTGMLNLRDALIFSGATGLDDWLLTEAQGVSADGLTIVGTGVHNGVTEAWVATIPEPSTLGLVFVAGLGLLVCFQAKTVANRALAQPLSRQTRARRFTVP